MSHGNTSPERKAEKEARLEEEKLQRERDASWKRCIVLAKKLKAIPKDP